MRVRGPKDGGQVAQGSVIMTASRKEIEEKTSRKYHNLANLRNNRGVFIGPRGDAILYGEDDRKDYFDLENDEAKRKLADATVLLTSKGNLIPREDGKYTLHDDEFRRGSYPPCSEERFGKQHVGGWCSGFMVGPDVIATAGHCGENEFDIQNTAYVFGFKAIDPADSGTTEFNADQVYFGAELLAHELSDVGDFALVRVDRPINAPGATPLPVRRNGRIQLGERIGVIGYPSGLPVKIAFGVETVVIRDEDPWLISNLDTYGGNSGSAVFNEAGLVEGILVRGARDYIIDYEKECFRSNNMANADGGEAITKAKVFADRIPEIDE